MKGIWEYFPFEPVASFSAAEAPSASAESFSPLVFDNFQQYKYKFSVLTAPEILR